MKAKDINKLKVGEIYYLPSGTWNYKKVTFVRIIDEKHVLVCNKKNRVFSCNISKLQKVPYKAVKGYKARERVKKQMNEMKQREQEKFINKSV